MKKDLRLNSIRRVFLQTQERFGMVGRGYSVVKSSSFLKRLLYMVRQRIPRKVKIGKNKKGAIEYWVDQEISLGETNDEMLIYLE